MPTKTTDGRKSPENLQKYPTSLYNESENQNLGKPENRKLNEDLKEELFLKKNTDSSNSQD